MNQFTNKEDLEDEILERGRRLAYKKYYDSQLTYDQFMSAMQDYYSILPPSEMKEVTEWKEKMDKIAADNKRQKLIDKQNNKKETQKFLFTMLWVLGFIVWLCIKLSQ